VVQGDVNPDGFFVGQDLTVYIPGDDANGTHHDLVFHLTNNPDKMNNTNDVWAVNFFLAYSNLTQVMNWFETLTKKKRLNHEN
jgi:hypothetical protein